MSKLIEKNNKVPFDPGFAPYVMVFSTTYDYINAEVRKVKIASQRKMKYKSLEMGILKLADNVISFYLGCMLYGAYLNKYYEKSPKEIDGNEFLGLPLKECSTGDVDIEFRAIENFVKNNDKNPFATRKINPKYISIVDNYLNFLEINNYFTDVKTTADIKIPSDYAYVKKYSKAELEKLINTILDSIKSKKIEKLLLSEYF